MAMELLPDDMLANVLGRLPPCSLAASRCVRKRWCSVVDARRLLRADLLPLRLDAFFCNSDTCDIPRPSFFAHLSAARRVGSGSCLASSDELHSLRVKDHCNGLILVSMYKVGNPATRQVVSLPRLPATGLYTAAYLAYDPMEESPHDFRLVVIHSGSGTDDENGMECLPSPYTAHVFSSREWRWEQRSFFVLQQEEEGGGDGNGFAAGEDAASPVVTPYRPLQAVYFRGALYVHHVNHTVIRFRLALSDDKCQMLRPPAAGIKSFHSYLGKSEKGVYSAVLDSDEYAAWPQFRVWFIHESCGGGHMEWVLKSHISLQVLVENFPFDHDDYDRRGAGPWINYETAQDDDGLLLADEEWDFDNGVILEATDKAAPCWCDIEFLGFHPYKEMAFFLVSSARAVSYHLSTSKVQELGILYNPCLDTTFPYTACRFKLHACPRTSIS